MFFATGQSIFRLIRSGLSSSSSIWPQAGKKCLRPCSSSSSSSSSFKTPFFLKESEEMVKDDREDKYVRKWLSMKTFQDQSIEDFKPYLKDEKEVKKMERILHEYNMIKYETCLCPSFLPVDRVREMLEINEDEKLKNYFHFLYGRENRKNGEKLKRASNRPEAAVKLRTAHDNNEPLVMGISYDPESGKPLYGKWRNSCFLDLGRKDEYTCHLPGAITASQFGQKIVIDFSYEDCMLIQEKKSLVKQMCFAHQAIRNAEEQFDTWFCNLHSKGQTYSLLEKAFGWDHQAKFTSHFMHRTPKSYLDLFPKEKLIYLCPDSSTDLTTFDHEAVYIIGGLVDRKIVKPVSLAKCKKEKMPTQRLPLDQYLSMVGSKILTIDQVVSILVHLKHGKSMKVALREAVPERKLKSPEQVELERNRRLIKLTLQRTRQKPLYSN